MYNTVFADDEQLIASFVPDGSPQIYSHKRQVIAVTNRRLIVVADAGMKWSNAVVYTTQSIDICAVKQVTETTTYAFGKMLIGIVLILIGLGIAAGGVLRMLTGDGVIYYPILAIALGGTLAFGVKRRALSFKTETAEYLWISGPLNYRQTFPAARKARTYIESLDPREPAENQEWAAAIPPNLDEVLVTHILAGVALPYVALVWGIFNLRSGKKKSGRFLLSCSLAWAIFFLLLAILVVSVGRK